MNSRNKVVRILATKCCSWGYRDRVPAQNYVGGPVPLLRNPAKQFFKFLVFLNSGFFLASMLTFIIQQFTVLEHLADAESKLKEL